MDRWIPKKLREITLFKFTHPIVTEKELRSFNPARIVTCLTQNVEMSTGETCISKLEATTQTHLGQCHKSFREEPANDRKKKEKKSKSPYQQALHGWKWNEKGDQLSISSHMCNYISVPFH